MWLGYAQDIKNTQVTLVRYCTADTVEDLFDVQ